MCLVSILVSSIGGGCRSRISVISKLVLFTLGERRWMEESLLKIKVKEPFFSPAVNDSDSEAGLSTGVMSPPVYVSDVDENEYEGVEEQYQQYSQGAIKRILS